MFSHKGSRQERVLLKDGDYSCCYDIIVNNKELPNTERKMIKEVIT